MQFIARGVSLCAALHFIGAIRIVLYSDLSRGGIRVYLCDVCEEVGTVSFCNTSTTLHTIDLCFLYNEGYLMFCL
jgi:hypothetical protein